MTPLYPCPRCTQPLPETAAFCRRCGITIAPGLAAGPRSVALPQLKPSAPSGGFPWGLAGVVSLAVLGGFFVIGWSTHTQVPSPATPTWVSSTPAPNVTVVTPYPTAPTPPTVIYPPDSGRIRQGATQIHNGDFGWHQEQDHGGSHDRGRR